MTKNEKKSNFWTVLAIAFILTIIIVFAVLLYNNITNPKIKNGEYVGMLTSYTNDSKGFSLKFSDGQQFYVSNKVYNEGKIIGKYDYLNVGVLYIVEYQIKSYFLIAEVHVTSIKAI